MSSPDPAEMLPPPANLYLGLLTDPAGTVLKSLHVLAYDEAGALAKVGTWPGYSTTVVAEGMVTLEPTPDREA